MIHKSGMLPLSIATNVAAGVAVTVIAAGAVWDVAFVASAFSSAWAPIIAAVAAATAVIINLRINRLLLTSLRIDRRPASPLRRVDRSGTQRHENKGKAAKVKLLFAQ